MIKVDCTHCEKPINDVFYSLVARDVENPAGVISGEGTHLHYHCVPPYFGWSRIGDPTEELRTRDPRRTLDVLSAVYDERGRQDGKWGEQNHPDGTGPDAWWQLDDDFPAKECANYYRKITQAATKDGVLTWKDIALEEIAEAFAEADWAKLRPELVQAAAVLVAWIEAGDRRANHPRNVTFELTEQEDDLPKAQRAQRP